MRKAGDVEDNVLLCELRHATEVSMETDELFPKILLSVLEMEHRNRRKRLDVPLDYLQTADKVEATGTRERACTRVDAYSSPVSISNGQVTRVQGLDHDEESAENSECASVVSARRSPRGEAWSADAVDGRAGCETEDKDGNRHRQDRSRLDVNLAAKSSTARIRTYSYSRDDRDASAAESSAETKSGRRAGEDSACTRGTREIFEKCAPAQPRGTQRRQHPSVQHGRDGDGDGVLRVERRKWITAQADGISEVVLPSVNTQGAKIKRKLEMQRGKKSVASV